MLVTCPRCGFEQPKDKFCAKCGIVMEGFVGKKPPLTSRLASSVTFYGIVISLLVGSFIFFYLSQSRITHDTINSPPPVSERDSGPAPPPPQTAANEEAPTYNAPSVRERGTVAPPLIASRAVEPNAANTQNIESNVSMEFVALSTDALNRLQQGSEGGLEIGRYSMAIIPQFKAKHDLIVKEGGFKNLGRESRNLTLTQPSLVFRGGKEPKSNEPIGFFVEVTPLRSSDRGTEYKISVKRSLPEILPSNEVHVVSQNFDETITLTHQSGLAVAGLLPRKPLVEGEDELYRANILKELLEPAFQRGDEEFVLLIYPQFHNNPTP